MTNTNDFLSQTAHQNHHQQTNGFLMNSAANSPQLMNGLNIAGSGSGGSTVGVSVSNSTQSTGTGGVNSANNSLNNGYGPNFGIAPIKQFDTESVLSIKSERVGLGMKTNLPNLYTPHTTGGLGRTHSSLSHYNNNSPNLHNNGQEQFVNYGFIGPTTNGSTNINNSNNNKLSSIFPQYQQQLQQQQHTGSQNNLPHVYFPSPQLSTNRFNQLNNNSLNNGSANNLINNLNGSNLSNNLQQQSSSSTIHQPFNTMSNLINSNQQQTQFTSLINNNQFTDNQNQFNNTINNRQRSVGRLERRVINNNFKNNNGYTNNLNTINNTINNTATTMAANNNFDDNQSFFNDACTAITGKKNNLF